MAKDTRNMVTKQTESIFATVAPSPERPEKPNSPPSTAKVKNVSDQLSMMPPID